MYPTLFEIFGYPIHSYGMMIVIGFTLALLLARSRAPKFGVDAQKLTDGAFYVLIAGVLGARIVFILQDLPYFLANRDQLFSLQFQGLTSFGGILFAVPTLIFWCKRNGIPVLRMFDVAAPAFLVGQMVGRVGCLLHGCCHGVACPPTHPLATNFQNLPNNPYIPAQLFDGLGNLIGLLLLLFVLERRNGLKLGQAAAFSFFTFGVSRFVYEFWRAGTPAEVRAGIASSTTIGNLPITEAHVMSAVFIIGSAAWFVMARKNPPAHVLPEELDAPTTESPQEMQPA
jgi:phosphatidylglycerol---prolipoprotein diacylglyceryl transferase